MSWAALVKATVPAPAPEAEAAPPNAQARVAVVDANAIISGLKLADVADKFVTTQDVLNEIRDKNARQFLANLQSVLEVQEPEDSSVAAVTAFARETGDLHALSRTDLRLLALSHTLEVAAHGSKHLRQHPVQATVKPKHRSKGGNNLPGWGTVPNPQDWAALDELPDSVGQGTSRIRTGPQALDVSADTDRMLADAPAPAPATATAQPSLPFSSFGAAAAADLATTADSAQQGPANSWFSSPPAATTTGSSPAALQPPPLVKPAADAFSGVAHFALGNGVAVVEGEHDDDEEEEEGEWAQAGKSRAAERRRRRNQVRYEARQQRRQEEETQVATAKIAVAGTPEQAAQGMDVLAVPAAASQQEAAKSVGTPPAIDVLQPAVAPVDDDEDEGDEAEESEDEGGESEDEGEEGDEGQEGEEQSGKATEASATDCGDIVLNTTSQVMCVTADFAMQNVVLQMGLRLVTRDGRQINRLSRWAVRCSACFFVTKEAGRVFCPRCGNMTLDRVEVTVGPDGAEFYGIRKKHVLRGTIFSLPKPKGGRAVNPVLREDEMLHKLKPGRKKKEAQKDLDPFAPEHGSHDPWGLSAGQQAINNTKGAQYLMAGWKHNPNERKPQASNRRRK